MAMSAVAALPSEWSETEQGNDEDGLAELFAAAPSVTELLDKLWGSTINGTFLTAAVMSKKNKTSQKPIVPRWVLLHSKPRLRWRSQKMN